ncbi:MAG: TatD family hydrolase [Candidatus Aminicenantes bacterium]|jgi:TatD DNase family protein
MNVIDFHCHLDDKAFDNNRKAIVEECFNSGFAKIVTVADPYEKGSYERTIEVLHSNKNVHCMTAAHPHKADHYTPEIEKGMLKFITDHNAIGYGEAGLDFYYNLSTPKNQQTVFKRQIAIANELQLPLIIHSREAEPEVLKFLEEAKFDLPVVFHCYTGSKEDAEEILKRGYYISISGIVTFKNTEYLCDIVKMIPLQRIFIETDSPYLSPVPFRGQTNTPWRVTLVAEKVAEIKEISVEQLNRCIIDNFNKITPDSSDGNE